MTSRRSATASPAASSLAAIILLAGACTASEQLPVLHIVPDFRLMEASGHPFGRTELLGRVHVVDFFFTECPLACPTMTVEMQRLAQDFENDDLGLVSISVDPEHDTSEVLTAYRRKLEVSPENWSFLRGELEEVREVSEKGFLLAASDLPYGHSLRFVLLDHQARIRGYYQSDDKADLIRLRRDLRNLLEASRS